MKRLVYSDVADAMASATTDQERRDANNLLAAYYSVRPLPESTRQRMTILREALERAVGKSLSYKE